MKLVVSCEAWQKLQCVCGPPGVGSPGSSNVTDCQFYVKRYMSLSAPPVEQEPPLT